MLNEQKNKIDLKLVNGLFIGNVDGKELGFKKLSWGEKNKVVSISQKMTQNGTLLFDIETFNTNLILACLKKAPFPISKESIENYPDALLMDKVLSICTQMNIADQVQIQNL